MPARNSNSKTLYDTLTVLHGTDALGASRNGYLGSDDLPKDKDTTVQILHCLHGTGTFSQGRQEEADFLELMWMDTLILRYVDRVVSLSSSALAGTKIASGDGYVYVPAALISQYQSSSKWSSYASQFRAIEDYPDICG